MRMVHHQIVYKIFVTFVTKLASNSVTVETYPNPNLT